MFARLKATLSNDLLIELSPELITIKSFTHHAVCEYVPWVAIRTTKGKQEIVGIGSKAQSMLESNGLKVLNPFSHPRVIISNFIYAEKILQYAIHESYASRFVQPSPRIIMHPLRELEGGLTQVEHRILIELAIGAGAREGFVYVGERINFQQHDFQSVKALSLDNKESPLKIKLYS